MPFDRGRLSALLAREAEAFATVRPGSRALFERAGSALLGGVPMPWMMRWAGGFPVFAREASGARIVDVDGHEYVDLCLGDTGAMPGHGPPVVVEAVREQLVRGITTMLPTEDATSTAPSRTGPARWTSRAARCSRRRSSAARAAAGAGPPAKSAAACRGS